MGIKRARRPGRTVYHEDIVDLFDQVQAITPLETTGSNVVAHSSPGGTWYEATGGGVSAVEFGVVGAAAIPAKLGTAPTGGDVYLYLFDGTDETPSADPVQALNRWGSDVPALAEVALGWKRGNWWVLGWYCAETP